jgi:hypothetical protein
VFPDFWWCRANFPTRPNISNIMLLTPVI